MTMSSRSLLLSANCINIFCTRFGNTCKTKAASLYATHEIVSEQCFCMKFCNSTKSGQGSISYIVIKIVTPPLFSSSS